MPVSLELSLAQGRVGACRRFGSEPQQPANRIYQAIRDGRFSFPERLALSDEFKSLVTGMLTVDVSQRLTVAQIREHPWMAKHGYEASPTYDLPALTFNLDDPSLPPLQSQGSSGLTAMSFGSAAMSWGSAPGRDESGFTRSVSSDSDASW